MKKKKKLYVVYWETGTNIHHYFASYMEAKKYVLQSTTSSLRIAKLLAYKKTKSSFIELKGDDKVEYED